MKISKKEFKDICADVSAENSLQTLKTAQKLNDENGGELAYTKTLMNVLFTKQLIKVLGFQDDDSEIEITKESFGDVATKVVANADEGMDSPAGRLIMVLEAVHFTTMLAKRLFGEETEDESN